MPTIEIDSNHRRQVAEIVKFVGFGIAELPIEARFVLAIEINRLLKPEVDEMKNRIQEGKA